MDEDIQWTSENAWIRSSDIVAGSYTISTTDPHTPTITDPNFTGYVTTTDVTWGPSIPEELKVCQVCGVEDVVVFCGECKNILNWARKKWAEAAMKELEDDLS